MIFTSENGMLFTLQIMTVESTEL